MSDQTVKKNEVKLGFLANIICYLLAGAVVTTFGFFILLYKGCRRLFNYFQTRRSNKNSVSQPAKLVLALRTPSIFEGHPSLAKAKDFDLKKLR